MNGTRRAIRSEMNATSRDSRSSFATTTDALAFFAKAGAAVERVGALPGFDLDELGEDFAAFRLGEAGERRALRFDPQAGLTLTYRRDPDVADNLRHWFVPCVWTNF
jgi:hypothetical protein